MKYAINVNCVGGRLEDKFAAFAKAGFTGVELRVAASRPAPCDPDGVGEAEAESVRKSLDGHGLSVVNAFKLHGWYELDGGLQGVADDWPSIKDECARRMVVSRILGAAHVIAVPAYGHRNHFAARPDGVRRYRELLDLGRRAGVPVTLEFMGQTQDINTLGKCLDFLGEVGDPSANLVLDSYHMWRGGGRLDDVDLLQGIGPVSCVHLADADPLIARESHRDLERPLPGDGFLDLKAWVAKLKAMGYDGYYSAGCYKHMNESDDLDGVASRSLQKMKEVTSV